MMLSQADHSWISSTSVRSTPTDLRCRVLLISRSSIHGYAPTGSDQTYQNGGATSPCRFSAHLRRYAAPCFPALRLRLSPRRGSSPAAAFGQTPRPDAAQSQTDRWVYSYRKQFSPEILPARYRQRRSVQAREKWSGESLPRSASQSPAVNAIADVEIRLIQRQRFN